jgi:hypothetical protein
MTANDAHVHEVYKSIYCQVYGVVVTNNNGFWIC